jgi:SLT domain-containing protein
MGVAKVAMDVIGVSGDPLGAIGGAGVSWVLGAVQFLREPFDVLQGDPGSISSSSSSWGGSASDLLSTAGQYRQASADQTQSWTGAAADGYRAASGNQANGLSALSEASRAVAGAIQQGGQALAQARKTVMDLISDAVQKIIQICIEALSKSWMSFGASIAEGIAKSVQQAVQTGQKLMQEIQSLVQTLQKIIQVVQKVVQIVGQVKELVELIGGKASGEQPHTMSTQQVTSNGAMATDTNPTGGGVPTADRTQVAPGYQYQTPDTAGANGTGGVQQVQAQQVAPGFQFQQPEVAAGTTPAQAVDPSQWPAPPAGVPSWGPTGPPPTDGVAAGSPTQVRDWIESARQVLVSQGVDPSLMNSDQMAGLIQHESSGNPNAINLWDSNATAGHPSKGLMQTIDSTFSEHHLPGYDNIYAPVDNIIAGTRYAIDRYGSISNVPGVRAVQNGGSYVGY